MFIGGVACAHTFVTSTSTYWHAHSAHSHTHTPYTIGQMPSSLRTRTRLGQVLFLSSDARVTQYTPHSAPASVLFFFGWSVRFRLLVYSHRAALSHKLTDGGRFNAKKPTHTCNFYFLMNNSSENPRRYAAMLLSVWSVRVVCAFKSKNVSHVWCAYFCAGWATSGWVHTTHHYDDDMRSCVRAAAALADLRHKSGTMMAYVHIARPPRSIAACDRAR